MWIAATILTVFVAVGAHSAWGYWRQSESFRREHRSWRTLIRNRWLVECLPRLLPSGVLVGALFVVAVWCGVISEALPESPWKDVLLVAFAAGLLLMTIIMAVVQPLILFYNVPSLLVAPHDRGKPGGLELRRRYRTRRS